MLLLLGFALAAMATAPVQAQTATETVLHHFASPPQGAYPEAGVVRDPAGNLYGTTVNGGAAGWGVVFKLDTAGRQTVLYNFTGGADGGNPSGGVIRDSAGNLYGTTGTSGSAPGDHRFRACRRSRWSAARARNPGTKPGARRQPYSAARRIF